MGIVTRFAPSPTGRLHVGNARTALIAWLFARRGGGRYVLRLDDTDAARSRDEHARAIADDLRWLGIDWDDTFRQSDRLAVYEDAFARLRREGRLYGCYETPEELEAKRRRQMARRLPPRYDRAGLRLTEEERRRLEAEGRRPHWRFRLDERDIAWSDLVRGPAHFDGSHLSDPVVRRADGTWLYLLPSVIDDAATGVTHVVRGEDHVANTPVQIQMFEALGAPVPAFAHLPLMTDAEGGPLSKRLGSLTLAALRDDGVESLALAAYLAHLGTAESPACQSMDELRDWFAIERYGRAAPRFNLDQLHAANAQFLRHASFAAVSGRLRAMGLGRADEAFWNAVRGNLSRLEEARAWHDVCFAPLTPARDDDPDFWAKARDTLPPKPWDEGTWPAWTTALAAVSGRKGRALFRPLRLALTGRDHGPELRLLLPLIGRDRALARLGGEVA